MLDEPRILKTSVQRTAVIHLKIPRDQIQTMMGPGIAEVRAAVAAQGIAAAGPWYTHHFAITPESWDFEIGVPVSKPVEPVGRVKPGELPARTVVRTVYHGPYEGLASAWGEFNSWIAASGREAAPDLWECYVAGPELNTDPATFRTELNRPITD